MGAREKEGVGGQGENRRHLSGGLTEGWAERLWGAPTEHSRDSWAPGRLVMETWGPPETAACGAMVGGWAVPPPGAWSCLPSPHTRLAPNVIPARGRRLPARRRRKGVLWAHGRGQCVWGSMTP